MEMLLLSSVLEKAAWLVGFFYCGERTEQPWIFASKPLLADTSQSGM